MVVEDFSNEAYEGGSKIFTIFYLLHSTKCELYYQPRNLEYTCKEGGNCIVDVSRRNQCQACRFSKCIKSNMRREGTFYFSMSFIRYILRSKAM